MLITLPYRERAALAIQSAAQDAHVLRGIVDSASVKNIWRKNGGLQNVNAGPVRSVGIQADLMRIAANQLKSPRISLSAMHISKVLFDRGAVGMVPENVQTLIGFPGASRRTFGVAPPQSTKVLHCVDAHPRHHNSALLSHFSKAECRAELYPEWLVQRIEAEIDSADLLLVPSELVADQMRRNKVPDSKIVVEPYGVDFELFMPKSSQFSHHRTTPKILYVGQISRRKGLGFLLEAIRNLPLELELIGNVFDPAIIQDLPPNVCLSPPLNHSALVSKYHEADAFVIPTIEDACSLVALEAAAAGLPVISTHVNGAMEILPATVSRVLNPGDTATLQETLRDIGPLDQDDREANVAAVRGSFVRSWTEYGAAIVSRTHGSRDD
ncbi:glycosyltransferase family 4 protein [Arthrobacter sp. BE255]|uniref:glycosyltransferase family 4 protein n=1 Tax=Arthrobacter sp. BE255 TaxID=2817721 RepID=UPI00285F2D66|nr:glycosyltransferase family 4 protein [Arthrobacter sp. BE255]MDR7160115.1 glycosyltransferase involved in cell wall biosynthesis [Arthrobacter sp. BE255]